MGPLTELHTCNMFKHLSSLPFIGFEILQDQLKDAINVRLSNSTLRARFGTCQSNAILLSGPAHSGKQILIKYIVTNSSHVVMKKVKVPLFYFHIAEESAFTRVTSDRLSSPLKKFIRRCILSSPCCILLDGLELLQKDLKWLESNDDLVSIIIKELETLKDHKISLIATTTHYAQLPLAFKHSIDNRLFTTLLEMELPNTNERCNIARELLEGFVVDERLVMRLAHSTVGKTAGQIANTVKEMISSIGKSGNSGIQSTDSQEKSNKNQIRKKNPSAATQENAGSVQEEELTSMMSKISIDDQQKISHKLDMLLPGFKMRPLSGYPVIMEKIERLLTWPHIHHKHYTRLGLHSTSGILLFGPSGCGKTSIAHYIASKSGLNLVHIPTSQLCSKYLGQTEENIRSLFARAKALKPSLLLLDDLDTLAGARDEDELIKQRIVTTLLNEMDGIEERTGVVILACSNRPWVMDAAILRPGRLDSHIYISLPNISDRLAIILSLDTGLGNTDLAHLAEITEGYTPADLIALLNEAEVIASLGSNDLIGINEVNEALKMVECGYLRPASVAKELLQQYEDFSS